MMGVTIPVWARKNAKVVCIDNGPRRSPAHGCICEPATKPQVGHVYTIRKVALYAGDLCLHLVEVRQLGLRRRFGFTVRSECPYLIGRFAPAVSTKNAAGISQADDISTHFQQLLTTPVGEDA